MPSSNVPWSPPLIRLNPWYPGQMGVPGTDNDTGLRLDSNGIVLYVDPNHVDANDNRDGTDPDSPLATVAAAIALCRAYRNDTIIVGANSNWQYGDTTVGRATAIAEEVTVDVPGIRIVGLAPPSSLGVYWNPLTTSGVCITVNAIDVLIEGFCFWTGSVTTPVGILAQWDGVTNFGDNLTVRHCYFEGGMDYGIQLDYSYNCHIHDNYFEGIDTAAIHNLDVQGDPDFSVFHHNHFMNCSAAFDLEDVSDCMIYSNLIYGSPTGTNNMIDLTGGSDNLVAWNALSCSIAQYDTTCSDATSGAWIENNCINGPTTANPT